MAALTADAQLTYSLIEERHFYPVADNVKIYKGSLVCINAAGYAVPAADTAGYTFAGFSERQYDNTVTGHAAGALGANVVSGRIARALPVSGASQASVGQPVYVADSGSVAFTSTNKVAVGVCVGYNSATSIDVFAPTPNLGNLLNVTPGQLDTLVTAAAGGHQIAAGTHTQVAASDTVVSGLAGPLTAVVVSLGSNPDGVTEMLATATIGNQAGAPASGSFNLLLWKATSATNPTLIAATAFGQVTNWFAFQ